MSPLFFPLLSITPLLSAEKEWKRKEQKVEEEEEEDGELDDELWGLRKLQKQELNKVGDPEPAAGADELQQFEVGQESPKITFTVRKAGNIHMQEAAFKNSHSTMNKA